MKCFKVDWANCNGNSLLRRENKFSSSNDAQINYVYSLRLMNNIPNDNNRRILSAKVDQRLKQNKSSKTKKFPYNSSKQWFPFWWATPNLLQSETIATRNKFPQRTTYYESCKLLHTETHKLFFCFTILLSFVIKFFVVKWEVSKYEIITAIEKLERSIQLPEEFPLC